MEEYGSTINGEGDNPLIRQDLVDAWLVPPWHAKGLVPVAKEQIGSVSFYDSIVVFKKVQQEEARMIFAGTP